MMTRPNLSVVVPFYNEQENVERMYQALTSALSGLAVRYELLFIDDGSRDATFERASALTATDDRLRVVKFRRNYGQTAAMAAGIEHARGEVIVTMDGDLQNDPRDIAAFLAKIDEGYDIVVGWRFNRQDKLVTRKIPSRIANALIAGVTGVPIRDNGCSLKAYRAVLIKHIPLYSEMHRFIPAMASVAGPRIAELQVRHHARQFGKSKYGLSRIYKVLLDMLVIKTVASFTMRPLHWFGMLAMPLLLMAGIAFTIAMMLVLSGQGVSLPIAGSGLIFLMSAVIFIAGGLLAEQIIDLGEVRESDFARLTERVIER